MEQRQIKWDCKGNEKLEDFLRCPADGGLYGGQGGAGKSEGILIGGIGDNEVGVMRNVNWKALLLRKTMPELEGTLIQRAKALFYGKWKYDSVKHRGYFPDGGMIRFGHLEKDTDKYIYQSDEFNYIGFDELTHFPEPDYLYLFSRLRTTDSRIRCKVRGATNPGGRGHAWVKNRFIQDEKTGKKYDPMKLYESVV